MKERYMNNPFFDTFAAKNIGEPEFSMTLIDSHTHLYLPEFDNDRQIVLENALYAGIEKMLLPNVDSGTIDGMLQLQKQFPGIIYPMMGLHPCSVKEDYADELKIIDEYFAEGGFIAVGEAGIDLYWDKTYFPQQVKAFEKQIGIAIELDLPIVVHARNSFSEIFEVLDQYKGSPLRGVFHSFTGGVAEIEKIVGYDFYFGINGIVTFKNSGLDKVIDQIPLERILLETDAPYLSPMPKRGIRNESSYLIYINDFLAKLLNLSSGEMAKITLENTLNLFKLR